MLAFRYFLTLHENADGLKVFISPDPEIDSLWARGLNDTEVFFWPRTYPLWLTEILRKELNLLLSSETGPGRRRPSRRKLAKRISKTLGCWGWAGRGDWIKQDSSLLSEFIWEEAAGAEYLAKALPGRSLTTEEISRLLADLGLRLPLRTLESLLHLEILAGRVERTAGVGFDETGRFQCRRCGEKHRILKEFIMESSSPGLVCDSCRSLGRMTSLTPLYRWNELPSAFSFSTKPTLIISDLAPWQETAVRETLDFWQNENLSRLLIWAVCGAGKTEVVFPVIAQALAEGKRVLFTVPRREIVRELGERIEKAFPGLNFSLLHGKEKREIPGAGMVLATTHQLLRFAPNFHLAILDEADAYPFKRSGMLSRALAGSLLPEGKMIYMTATPDRQWREKAVRGEIAVTRILLRYHGHPLPEPILLKRSWSWSEEGSERRIPPEVTEFLHRAITKGRQVLIFLPTVRKAELVGRALERFGREKGASISYIHSRDPLRDRKLRDFYQGRLTVLVTTTLLERGLNFPYLDLVVLDADDHSIFTTETLVQIAGRVGRSADSPKGEILMIGETISREMREARIWIKQMNREAKRAGFL